MRVVIQRVKNASVSIKGQITSEINHGLLLLVGFEQLDNQSDIDWIINKTLGMRIFSDANQKMNLSISQIKGDLLIVSQFTLLASTKKGNRPSFIRSASPDKALDLYNLFVQHIKSTGSLKVKTGEFGSDMQISLINDGPVTITLDSKNKE